MTEIKSDRYFRIIVSNKSTSIIDFSNIIIELFKSITIVDNDFLDFEYCSTIPKNNYNFRTDGFNKNLFAENYLNDNLKTFQKYHQNKTIDIDLIDKSGYVVTFKSSDKKKGVKFYLSFIIGTDSPNLTSSIILKFPKSKEENNWIDNILNVFIDNFEVDYANLVSNDFINNVYDYEINEFWLGPINFFSTKYNVPIFDSNSNLIKYAN